MLPSIYPRMGRIPFGFCNEKTVGLAGMSLGDRRNRGAGKDFRVPFAIRLIK